MDDDQYRVLPGPDTDSLRLLGRESYEPVRVARKGHDAPVSDLRPGYLVDADIDWSGDAPTVAEFEVVRPTLYTYLPDIEPVFEVARDLWDEAQANGEGIGSCVTRNTDNEVNGAVYVFANSGPTSRFNEFHDGSRPLEPLVDRINDRDDDGPTPREVFVCRPAATTAFVVVTIALEKAGLFADTIRDTYDCPMPPEPLV